MRETEILKGLEGGENMAVRFVDNLLALGLREKASDIHLEPGEEQMTVRMRTDGQLKVCAAMEMRHHPSPPLSEYRYSHRQPGNLRHE